jgi:hypothetical protein
MLTRLGMDFWYTLSLVKQQNHYTKSLASNGSALSILMSADGAMVSSKSILCAPSPSRPDRDLILEQIMIREPNTVEA